MREFVPCFFVLVILLLGMSNPPAHAADLAQTPTPPVTEAQADALLEECFVRYIRDSDPQGALELCHAALSIMQEIGDRQGEATAMTAIGSVYHDLSDYEQALTYLQQALFIQQEIGDRSGEAMTLSIMEQVQADVQEECDTRHDYGDFQGALEACQTALSLYRQSGDRDAEARTLGSIGLIYRDLSNYDQALTYLQQALSIFREIGSRDGEETALGNIAMVYYYLSDYEQALTYYQQALHVRREISNKPGEAGALNNIAEIYHTLYDYVQALTYHQQALFIFREIGDRIGEATALYNIGRDYYRLFDYEQALAYYQQALSIWRQVGDRASEAETLNNAGAVYRDLADYEQALTYFQQALTIFRKIGDRANEAGTLNNISVIYWDLSDCEHALAYSQQALSIFRDIGNRKGEATALDSAGIIYRQLSDYQQALTSHQQALFIFREIGDRAGEATALSNIGVVYHGLSNYEQSLDYYRQALSIFQEIGDRDGEAIALNNLAEAHEALEQEDHALEYALQAIVVVESIYGKLSTEALKTIFAASISEYYGRAIHLLLTQGREVEAFHYAERGRARILLTLLGNRRVNPKSSEDPTLIQQEAQLRGELAGLERQLQEEWDKPEEKRSQQVVDHVRANLEAHRQEYEDLLTQLQLTNPEYAALVGISPLTLEEAQALLREQAPDVTLVSYFVGEKQVIIFIIGPETFYAATVSVSRKELYRQTEALLAQMRAAPLLPQAWQEPAQALYEWLVAPVQEYLPPASTDAPPRLGVIPHDLLHYLPFGLLYDGEQTLLDGYTLFYAPSVSTMQFIFEKRHPQADSLLAFANPDALGAPHLSYAVEEAQAVAALYRTQPFVGEEATEGQFKARAGRYGLVHVAAHSDYSPHSPLFSAILLAEDESEDGRLETHEVFNLDLPQTDLVVLSACETHLGELSSGDELVGLERAFVRAGSPSLLTTLWPVDDAATAELMKRFYTHLRAGVPKAEALRLAQMETRKEHLEPYYWAGFMLVGDAGVQGQATVSHQPTPVEGESSRRLCCGGLAALLGMVGTFRWRHRRRGLGGKNVV